MNGWMDGMWNVECFPEVESLDVELMDGVVWCGVVWCVVCMYVCMYVVWCCGESDGLIRMDGHDTYVPTSLVSFYPSRKRPIE